MNDITLNVLLNLAVFTVCGGFPGGSVVKKYHLGRRRLPEMQETWVQSLGQEDPQRRKWQQTPVFLPGNPMDRGPWRATVHRLTEETRGHRHNLVTKPPP